MSTLENSLPVLHTVSAMRQFRSTLPEPVALVPTMGMLHRGHMSLIRLAARRALSVVVSVYVNPTQLTSVEEQGAYPVNLDDDVQRLQHLKGELCRERQGHEDTVLVVFAPTDQEMYPHGTDLRQRFCSHVVISPELTRVLEGEDHPTHFLGVGTVCLKLFNMVRPQLAVFGEKDYQQTVVIKRLVEEFLLGLEVVVAPTIREADGLAVSSRNAFLGLERRAVAAVLHRALKAGIATYQAGQCRREAILEACRGEILRERERQSSRDPSDQVTFEVIYFGLSDRQTLEDVEEVNVTRGALLSGAMQMLPFEVMARSNSTQPHDWVSDRASVRLIDSLVL